jgi:hypothetical protein
MSVMIPLFQIIFGTKMFKKVWILEYLGCFYKVNCGVDLGFLTHLFSERCLNCWLVKKIITGHVLINFKIDSYGCRVWCSLIHNWITRWAPCRDLFYLKESWHGKSVRCYQTFLWVRFLRCFCNYHIGRHVERLKIVIMAWGVKTHTLGRHVDWKFNHMDQLKPVGFWKPTRWAPCRLIKNQAHGLLSQFWVSFFYTIFEGVKKLTYFWVAVVSNHHVRAPCRECKPKKGINLGQ